MASEQTIEKMAKAMWETVWGRFTYDLWESLGKTEIETWSRMARVAAAVLELEALPQELSGPTPQPSPFQYVPMIATNGAQGALKSTQKALTPELRYEDDTPGRG